MLCVCSCVASQPVLPAPDTCLPLVHPTPPTHTAGVLFDASQLSPAVVPTINLAEPGPRACSRLWAAVLECLIFVDAAVGAGAA